MNLLIIFLTGLTTGGLSCLAMQGGLLASVIANQKEQEKAELNNGKKKKQSAVVVDSLKNFSAIDLLDWAPVAMFLVSKLVAHILLGFLLGILGSKLTLSLEARLFFQAFTALFMFASAMNLLNVHPIFRFLAFTPPKFLNKLIRNTSKSRALFAPMVLGVMTIFVPCGVTQAMEVLAINSAHPVSGALIMAAFILGTSPIFAILGVATAKLSETLYQKFAKFAAWALIVMAIYSLNGVLIVANSPLTINKMISPITYFFSKDRFAKLEAVNTQNGAQQVTINVMGGGYNPSYIRVKKGIPVNLTLQSNNTYSCALSFVFREFGIRTNLKSTDTKSFTFTPQKPGKYVFTCSMGMYTGVLEVI